MENKYFTGFIKVFSIGHDIFQFVEIFKNAVFVNKSAL